MGAGDKTRARVLREAKRRENRQKSAPRHRERKAAPSGPALVAPTPQQEGKGRYRKSKLMGGPDMVVNLAQDMIGRLLCSGAITPTQEQAARHFQEIRAAYLEEIGTRGYGSCLDIGVGGHDESDGNPAVIAEYRRVERLVGGKYMAVLADECEKGPEGRPYTIGLLRSALTAFATRC